ncbi:NAD-binding protein [Persephonella sp.]
MKICIIGAGVVGSYLAKKLSEEGYDIAVVDKDRDKIEELQRSVDVASYHCDAFKEECISELKEYELFIVVTNKDEINLSIALMLRAVFKKEKILVRIDEDILSKKEIENFLSIDIVNTFNEIYKNIEMILKYPFMTTFNELDDGKFLLFSYKVSKYDGFINRKIADLNEIRIKIPFTIALLERDGKFIIPTGQKVILEDDIIYILLEKSYLERFIDAFKIKNDPIRSIYFLGISKLGLSLVKKIRTFKNLEIKIFEPDIDLCEQAAEICPESTVIHTGLIDEDILRNEGIDGADLVISASYREENILSCMLAKRLGAKKILAFIEHPEYEDIAHILGIDVPLVARKIVARRVYRKIKHKGFIDTFEIMKNLKVSEIYVDKKLADRKVEEISSGNFVILGIKRDDEMYIARGNTVLLKGDILIVLEKEEYE